MNEYVEMFLYIDASLSGNDFSNYKEWENNLMQKFPKILGGINTSLANPLPLFWERKKNQAK